MTSIHAEQALEDEICRVARRLALDAGQGEYKLQPSGPGGGEVRDKQKAALDEIIARVNPLFVGELTEGDKLLCVDKAIKSILLGPGKLYELLRQQRSPSASDAQGRIAFRSLSPWSPA
jgi:hypothetical protein